MHDSSDRLTFCRCFEAAPSFFLDAGPVNPAEATRQPVPARRPPAPSLLRPDVHCLQRWIDLSA
jgi:hypothetical protein